METINHRIIFAGEICELAVKDGINIELFRSVKYTGDRDELNGFRPAKVLKNGTVIWSFQNSGASFGQVGELHEFNGEYIIVLRDKFTIFDIVRVNDFSTSVTAKLAGKIVTLGGSSVEEILNIKLALAIKLKVNVWRSPEESAILDRRVTNARNAREEESLAKTAAKAESRRKREEFVKGILARNTVEAWSTAGKCLFGTPVTTDDEWTCLPDGNYCILMQEGKPIEAFIVSKNGSKVKKVHVTEVSTEKPQQKKEEIPEALDQRMVTLHGESRSILIFDDIKKVKQLQASGLNSGTWIGVLPNGSDTLTVYSVKKSNIDTVGLLKKKSYAEHIA